MFGIHQFRALYFHKHNYSSGIRAEWLSNNYHPLELELIAFSRCPTTPVKGQSFKLLSKKPCQCHPEMIPGRLYGLFACLRLLAGLPLYPVVRSARIINIDVGSPILCHITGLRGASPPDHSLSASLSFKLTYPAERNDQTSSDPV